MRSGVGAAWDRPLDFLRDFEETRFFFLAVELEFVEEACGAVGRAPADTTRAALAKSAAPKMISEVRFSIVSTWARLNASPQFIAREPERRRRDTRCQTARRPIAAGL